jgi:hypothetical protein
VHNKNYSERSRIRNVYHSITITGLQQRITQQEDTITSLQQRMRQCEQQQHKDKQEGVNATPTSATTTMTGQDEETLASFVRGEF